MTKEKTETKRKKERKGSRKAKTKERKKEKKKTGRRKRKSGKRRRKKGRAEKRKREKRREKREIKKIISFIKTCTRLGTLLPQINLSPGSGLSCHKKISRPDGREIFFKQQTICFRAPDYSSPLAYLLAISDIGMALI